ncbi:MAG TPA: exonuclease domain-containing protein [Acidobacteriota bacterium]|nr:exonuclease domain-containing protein [Acidobacteriota bacterium]
MLASCSLVFVDVETTGLSPGQGDRVCEIALIRRDPDGGRREWSSLIDPGRAISPGAFAVNGITPEMVQGAPRFAAVIPQMSPLIAGGVWVAHNAAFDLGFLQSEYTAAGFEFPELPVIDTVAIARRHFRFPSNRLGALADRFGVANPQEHRALGDCRTTEAVFRVMIEQAFRGRDPLLSEVSVDVRPVTGRAPDPGFHTLPASLAEILRRDRRLEIVYVSAGGQKTTRPIHVREVIGSADGLCLVADCELRRELRHFRLDRIIDWKPLNDEPSSCSDP